jgi:hypothetical protein
LEGEVTDAAHPQLATAPDGAIHLVWQGRYADSSVIAHRVWRDGAWGDEAIISASEGDQVHPALAIGQDGTVHVAWAVRLQGRWAIAHSALRPGAGWGGLRILSDPGAADSEFPAIAARSDGGADVVWQMAQGTGHLLLHASVDASGAAAPAAPISAQRPDSYSVYPQVFLTPSPIVCWYEYQPRDGNFALRAAEQVPGPTWRRIPVDDLLLIDPNRLPYLVLSDVGIWAALWHDAAPQRERVLLGIGGLPTLGEGTVVDANPDFDNGSPQAAAIGPDGWAVTWRGETALGPEIYLSVPRPHGWQQHLLSEGLTPAAAQPAITVSHDTVHVVWTSDVREGGNGRLTHGFVPLD